MRPPGQPHSLSQAAGGTHSRARATVDSFNATIGTEPHTFGCGAFVFERVVVGVAGEAAAGARLDTPPRRA